MKSKLVKAVLFSMAAVILLLGCDFDNVKRNWEDEPIIRDGRSYTVTFHRNDGSGTPPPSMMGESGESINLPGPENLSRTNHTFGGWNAMPDGSGRQTYGAGDRFTVPNQNVTLYAKWDAISVTTYTVTYNVNNGSGTVPSPHTGLNAGSSITLRSGSSLSRSGFTFGGWNRNAAGTGDNFSAGASFTVPNQNVTLYAKWDASNPFLGTWYSDRIYFSDSTTGEIFFEEYPARLVFQEAYWTILYEKGGTIEGNYTYSGNSAILRISTGYSATAEITGSNRLRFTRWDGGYSDFTR